EAVWGGRERPSDGGTEDNPEGRESVEELAKDVMREEADEEGMGRHEDDRRRARLSLDLERGDPEGKMGRQDRPDEPHERGIPPLYSQQRLRLPEGSAPDQDRRPDDAGGDGEPVQGDRDGRRGARRDESRGQGDGG